MRNHRRRRVASLISAAAALTGIHWGGSFAHATSYAATWVASGGGNWTDPNAWSIAPLYPDNNQPNLGDRFSAYIGPTSQTGVVIQADSIGLDQLAFASPGNELELTSGGTLAYGGTISAGSVQLDGGSLIIQGDLNVASNLTWNNGTISGFGNVNVASNGSINLRSGILATTLNNSGLFAMTQSSFAFGFSGGTLNNLSSGVINITTAQPTAISSTSLGGYITNAGTMNISTASQQQFGVAINDSGTINITSGTLLLSHTPGSATTTYTFSNGAVVSGAGTVLLGTSEVHNIAGVVTFSAAHFSLDGATIMGPGTINLTSSMNWNSGQMGGTSGSSASFSTLNVAQGALLNIGSNAKTLYGTINNGGTINVGSISGTGVLNNLPGGTLVVNNILPFASTLNVTNSGTMIFTSGSKSLAGQISDFGTMVLNSGATVTCTTGTFTYSGANITGNATFLISGSTTQVLAGPLTLSVGTAMIGQASISGSGDINVASGTAGFATGITIAGPGAINIGKGASAGFDSGNYSRSINNSGTANFGNGEPIFTNASFNNLAGGVVNFRTSGQTYTVNWPFSNAGTVSVANGTLQLANNMIYNSGAAFSGVGTVVLSNGTLNASLNLYNANTVLGSNSTLTGPGDLNVYNNMNWNGGTLGGKGSVNVMPGATLSLPASYFVTTRNINNSGTLSIASILEAGTITNQAGGVINFGNTASFSFGSGTATMFNNGTINVPFGISLIMPFTNSGTINVTGSGLGLTASVTHDNSYISGSGTVNVAGFLAGNLTLAGTNQFLFQQNLSGPGDVILTGVLRWSGGTVDSGGGAMRIAQGATLNLPTIGQDRMLNRTLINSGVINASTSLTLGTSGLISNTSTGLINAAGFGMLGNGSIGNSGTINCTSGSNSLGFLNNSGTVIVGTTNTSASLSMPDPVQYDYPRGILTGGNWIVRGQSTLSWVGNMAINQARVTLDGAGATLSCLSTVNTNQGILNVLNGANLATSGSFTNQAITTIGNSSVIQTIGTVANTGTVDVNGLAIANYSGSSPQSDLVPQIASGFAGGVWTGPGINSDLAATAADSSTIHKTAIGYSEASALGIVGTGMFDGQSVDDTTFIMRYVYSGDANLDGTVDSSDFALLSANFGGTGQEWVNGDYNYDGIVNALDFNALATNYGQSLSASAVPDEVNANFAALVPEPIVIALPALVALFTASRRRRNPTARRGRNI